ncbi:unnamed protein product (macronuclear) [Paramecium tetraurelia]|uniref:Uncharacterized protein n=1 Tax=Paramecium tetraurelia TaxID=5888 RepID=A0BZL5_PARTE|nr:uncharacterized protein GSPATT00005834001 [Paramecium tetraurelia]CAK63982.1 unnamed protein product [Paramecium tetraurelia]|eukprot:XP_001431380.1 hypothetical protein (macronuclear) [Paramecium tetraurelia strain d4-2]
MLSKILVFINSCSSVAIYDVDQESFLYSPRKLENGIQNQQLLKEVQTNPVTTRTERRKTL